MKAEDAFPPGEVPGPEDGAPSRCAPASVSMSPCLRSDALSGGTWIGRAIARVEPTALLVFGCGLLLNAGLIADEDAGQVRQAMGFHARRDAFTFARIQYDSTGGRGEAWYAFEGRVWQRWETDYPRAELNLLYRLNELTAIAADREPVVIRLTDDSLFDFPFIFMSDVGWQVLSGEERKRLLQYLNAGGFLWIDDFWGAAEWDNLERNTQQAAPGWTWKPIPADHPILSIVYPLNGCPQIPAKQFFEMSGLSYDPAWIHRRPNGGDLDLRQVHFRGLFDAKQNLAAIATHNSDIGDGWEREGESKAFFERFSIRAYALGINVLVYAMTH